MRVVQRTPSVGIAIRMQRVTATAPAPSGPCPPCEDLTCPDIYFAFDGHADDLCGDWTGDDTHAKYIARSGWGQAITIDPENFDGDAAILSGPTTGPLWTLAFHMRGPGSGWRESFGEIQVMNWGAGSLIITNPGGEQPRMQFTVIDDLYAESELIALAPADRYDRWVIVSDENGVRVQRGSVVYAYIAKPGTEITQITLQLKASAGDDYVYNDAVVIDELAIWRRALSEREAALVSIAGGPLRAPCGLPPAEEIDEPAAV
jgi:hypothetical protein